jgi:Site-specific recombinases, DNA invertase Pin homologs
MTRAAIYARFSSDLQNDRSIEDQAALCRTICDRAGYEVVALYQDRALSGTSTAHRAGFQAMMQAAGADLFDAIVAEDVDRIARDQADWHWARKRLDFLGIKIHTPGGVVGRLDGSVRAMMAEHFIENLALHVRRGMAGVIREGRNAGGRAYGYRPILGKPGELETIEEEAETVRRIFELYTGGRTPREIAAMLNAENIAPPRGRFWRASSILGNPQRGHGIICNPIYMGRLVWNRVRMVRDPDTGKRVSRVNPKEEWQSADVPHLRIIEDALFQAAQDRRNQRTKLQPRGRIKPRHPLSGLLRCGACGAGMSVKDRDRGRLRIICSQFKEAGQCDNGRSYYLDTIERTVIGGLQEQLGSHEAIAYYIKVFNEERSRASAQAAANFARLETQLADAQRDLDRIIDAVIKGRITDEEADARLPALREARDSLKRELELAEKPPKVISLHPAVVDEYLRNLDRLAELIGADLAEGDSGLALALRSLIDTVTVMPAPAREAPVIRVSGHLASLLGADVFPQRSFAGGAMVAEEGFEPPTQGL